MTVTLANCVSYYQLEAVSGTRVDERPAGNDLSPTNAPGNATGIVGDAVDLVRASQQYLSITDAAQSGLDITGNITMSGGVYLNSLPSAAGNLFAIAGKWTAVGNLSYLLRVSNVNNRVQFIVSSDGTVTTLIEASTFGALSTGVWYYVAARWDGAFLYLRVNGTDQTPVAFAGPIKDGNSPFIIGHDGSGANRYMNGRIDQFSIWNEFASDSQLTSFYNSGAQLSYAQTRALFDVTITPSTSTAIAKTSGPIAVVTPAACGVRVVQPFAGDYQLYFVDPVDGSPIDLVPISPRIHSLKYNLKLNDISEVRFTVDATDRLVERIIDTEDVLCDVMRRNTKNGNFETEKTFFIRYQDLFEEDNRRQSVIFAGVSVEDLLRRRLIIPDDDLLGAAGFSTKSGLPDLVMIQYVRDQCIVPALNSARVFPEFYLAPFTPDSVHTTYQRVNQQNNLLEVLQDIANTSNMDFEVYRTEGRRLEFLAHHIGQDFTTTRNEFQGRPFVLFSDRRANIQEPRLTYDRRTEATYMFVAGNGIEEDRIYVPQPSTRMVASPYNRIEAVIDSRDDDTIDQMLATASAVIQQQLGKWVFEWKVAFGQAQTRYNVDWRLGDRVTAEYQDVLQNFRLIEMQVEVKDSGEKLTPNFQQEL